MRPAMRDASTTRGFSLLEVLIALVVFSLGMLGMTGLLAVSMKVNHGAYLRSQASFLAQSMADRMRANSRAVWANSYNDADYPISGSDPCSAGAACSFANVAIRDKVIWSQQLTDQLPSAAASISCTATAGIITPDAAGNPPYNGLCTMTISWNQTSLVRDTASADETFAWVFQP